MEKKHSAVMLGAVAGDLAGSGRSSGDAGSLADGFPLFSPQSKPGWCGVMTCAVASGLLECSQAGSTADLGRFVGAEMRRFYRSHPNAEGYEPEFREWLQNRRMALCTGPGCSPAVRVSPAGWFAGTLEDAEEIARISACVSHSSSDAADGAVCVAGCVFLARCGRTKDDIACNVRRFFAGDAADAYGAGEGAGEGNLGDVRRGISAFLCADSFEEAVRRAMCGAANCSAAAAVAGSIAEPFFGIPDEIANRAVFLSSIEMSCIIGEVSGAANNAASS